MPLDTEVGLDPGHIVLNEDPAPLPRLAKIDIGRKLGMYPF